MKTLKFRPHLAELILKGEKTTTWRLFDDKDIAAGDEVELVNWESGATFGRAEIVKTYEKPLRETNEADLSGHEKYEDPEEMLAVMKKYYGERVTLDTPVKVIFFKLL